jgi:hypothetical protein
MTLGRHLLESHLAELPLTSKRRRSPERRTSRAISCVVGEERVTSIQQRQVVESIHEST